MTKKKTVGLGHAYRNRKLGNPLQTTHTATSGIKPKKKLVNTADDRYNKMLSDATNKRVAKHDKNYVKAPVKITKNKSTYTKGANNGENLTTKPKTRSDKRSDWKKKNYSESLKAKQLRMWKAGAYGNISKSKAVDGLPGKLTSAASKKYGNTVKKVAAKKATVKVKSNVMATNDKNKKAASDSNYNAYKKRQHTSGKDAVMNAKQGFPKSKDKAPVKLTKVSKPKSKVTATKYKSKAEKSVMTAKQGYPAMKKKKRLSGAKKLMKKLTSVKNRMFV